MSAYIVVEFTVKDPDVYREKYAPTLGRRPRSTEERCSPPVIWKSCTAMARSLQGRSFGFPTMRRLSTGTTRLNISS